MSQSTVSRVRFAFCALGVVVVGASLFNWAHGLHVAGQQYRWVDAAASDAPAVDTAEIWQVSAKCVRPYFVRAALRSKAKLKAYYDLAPEAVRAGLARSPDIPQPAATPKSWYRLVKNQPFNRSPKNGDPAMEYSALLHVQYAEWYANVFKLEIEASQWQQRLAGVTDQRLMLGESTRKGYGGTAAQQTAALDATGGFDSQVLTTLGLGGFPKEEEQALKADCVRVNLVNKVVENPNYFSELWRWPVEQTAAFALGIELVLLGIFLVPMTLWIGTGDAQPDGGSISRLTTKIRSFGSNERLRGAAQRFQTMRAATRSILAELVTRSRPVVEDLIVLVLRWIVLPGIALGATVRKRCAALLRRHVGFQNAGNGLDLIARILRQTGADRTA